MKRTFVAALAALSIAGACNKANTPATTQAATQMATSENENTVVATYNDQKVTLGELDKSIARELYDLRRQNLEAMILKKLVGEEAKKAGKDEETFLREIAEKRAAPVTDEEAKKIYDENKAQLGDRDFESVKPMIVRKVQQEKQRDAVMAYFQELKQKSNVNINLPEPKVEVAATGPAKGPDTAPVTIVEFSDFQCPFCSKVEPTITKVMANYAGKVRVVWRDFPLPFHDKALKAAEAGLCAADQNKFWEMHDYMFEHQDKLDPADLKGAVKGLGMDEAKFADCLDKGQHAADVQKNIEAGKTAGVSGTPAFFINGHMISGAQPYEAFQEQIDKELKTAQK